MSTPVLDPPASPPAGLGELAAQKVPAAPRPWDLTLGAALTGMGIGAALSACNIYSGLKIGWSTNMSITGALLAYGVWQLRSARQKEARPFTILDTNMSQTAASSAAAVSSAGLVAGIPALSLLTGHVLTWPQLAAWVLSVCLVGNTIGVPIRRQMLEREPLPFPFGIATAETLTQMYARGSEAIARLRVLLGTAVAAALWKPLEHYKLVKSLALPGAIAGVPLKNLTFSLDPSPLLIAIGGLMGLRACLSLLAGAVLAYGVLGPELLARGVVARGNASSPWFKELVGWLLWPGVTLMVLASLTSFALSWKSMGQAFRGLTGADGADPDDVPARWFNKALVISVSLSVTLQILLFDIPVWAALLGVLLSFALAIVGARVSGETGVTPVGAMGKVTQLAVGAALPGDVTANLMTANVTGGAASQCGDLMNDFKTGKLVGATPRAQWVAQLCGSVAGALVGSAIYLVLIHDPQRQLITAEWAAPAVVTWKAVAEVFKVGLAALPAGAVPAMAIAGAAGIALAVADARAPAPVRRYLPSASAMGLGFVVPANQSFSMFLGGVLAALCAARFRGWHGRFWVVACAGVVAGESLMGVALNLVEIAR